MLNLSDRNIALLANRYADPFTAKVCKDTLKLVRNYLKKVKGKATEEEN